MLDIGFFYLLLLAVIVLLILIILLYSGFHSRILAPPLMNADYGISYDEGTAITNTAYGNLFLNDGVSVQNTGDAGVSGGFDFGVAGSSDIPFEILPLMADRNRALKGKITLYGYSSLDSDSGTSISFRLIDENNGNKEIAQPTKYIFKGYDYGLQEFKLYFNAPAIDNRDISHKFALQGKSESASIPSNRILINSAYLYYY
jgi:hypothetical protein